MRLGYLIIMVAMGLVTACGTSTNGAKAPPKFDSGGYAAIAMNARRLEIVENWQMPMEAPYIGHFQTPYPSNIVAEWAASVLQPAGGSGELISDISKASVTKEKLPRETNLQGILSDQQDTKVRVELVARLMWLQPVGGAKAMVNLSASQPKTIPESFQRQMSLTRQSRKPCCWPLAALDKQAREELQKIDNVICLNGSRTRASTSPER